MPYVFVREIPNKPPPPYQPPSKATPKKSQKYTIPTNAEQIGPLITKITDILYKSYISNNLTELSPSSFAKSKTNNPDEINYNHFLFDLCTEVANEHLKCETYENLPTWLRPANKKIYLPAKKKSKGEVGELMEKKVNECLGYVSRQDENMLGYKENLVVCWNRKKRDHVDEILVRESQLEEIEWTNFDDDEVAVKNQLTNDIFDLLIKDTVMEIRNVVAKKYNNKVK